MSYLEHHGIKGQRWGIRRYQNPDGSLTSAGKKRYGISGAMRYRIVAKSPFEKKREKLAKKEQRMTEKEEIARRKYELRERKEKLRNRGKTQKQIQNDSVEERRKQQLESERKRNGRNVSDMTDDELRAVINRYNLEKQYKEIMRGPQKQSGMDQVKKILATVGTTVLTKELTKAATNYIDKNIFKERSNNESSNNNNAQTRRNRDTPSNNSNRRSDSIRTGDLFDENSSHAGSQRDRVEVYWRQRGRRN